MTRIRSSVFATVTLFVVAGCSDGTDPAQPAGSEEVPLRFRPLAAELERERQALEIPGLAVAILEHGELAFAHGFGTKGIDSTEPIDAETLFRIGSMSKLLTALGTMSAVDDGLLDLDAPIRDTIPDLSLTDPESDRLTLRHLLSQQSGLSDFLALPGPAQDEALAAFTSGPELSDNVGFLNPTGLFWNYSNPNYYIAGRALEASTGVPYRQAISERVFQPLGMQRSYFLPSEVIADGDYTHGFGIPDVSGAAGAFVDLAPEAYDNAWARPAGFAYSTVLDWVHVMQFLIDDHSGILSEASRQEVVAPQISAQAIYADLKATALGLGDDYGLGVGMGNGFFMDRRAEPETYYAAPFLGHGGDIPGFASTYVVLPESGFGMVVLSNRDAERPVESMRFALESYGDLPPPSAPPRGRAVDPARFSRYAGTYLDGSGVAVNVRLDAGTLVASGPLLDGIGLPYEPVLEASSLDNFLLWVTYNGERVSLEVTFIPDATGNYSWFRSRAAVAQRQAEVVGP